MNARDACKTVGDAADMIADSQLEELVDELPGDVRSAYDDATDALSELWHSLQAWASVERDPDTDTDPDKEPQS